MVNLNKDTIRRLFKNVRTGVLFELIKRAKAEYIFLVLGSIFGICFLFFTAPLGSFDETEHFFRSYQVSDLQFISAKVDTTNVTGARVGLGYGGSLPISVVDVATNIRWGIQTAPNSDKSFIKSKLTDGLKVPLNVNMKKQVRFDNTAIYSPTGYIPQALGIGVGKLVNASPVYLIYLGRLANLVVWLLLIFLAIKITPIGKYAFVVIALNPVSVFLAATLSPDTVAAGVMALVVAFVLYLRRKATKVTIKQVILLSLLLLTCVLTKNIYIPITLIVFALPIKVMHLWVKLAIIGVITLIGVSWNASALPMTAMIPVYFGFMDHINAADQVNFITHNVYGFLKIVIWNLVGTPSVAFSYLYMSDMAGNTVPNWASILWVVALVLVFLMRDNQADRANVTKRLRILFTACVGLVVAAIVMSLYIGWSPVGSKIMNGIQGRYFIPISFMLIPVIANAGLYINKTSREKYGNYVVIGALVVVNAGAVFVVALRYWHGIDLS